MPPSLIYVLAIIAFALALMFRLLQRQTATRLAQVQRQLEQERKDREGLLLESSRRETARASAEKELGAAKHELEKLQEDAKALAEARGKIGALEADLALLKSDRDEAQRREEEARRALAERGQAEQAAEEKLAALRGEVEANARKAAELEKAVQAARAEAQATAKKLADEARLRKAAEDGAAASKGAEARVKALEAEAAAAKERIAALEAESSGLREAAARTPVPGPVSAAPAASSADGGGFVAALEGDPALNRGQKETIRMMYDKFTANKAKR
jgi:colicin import membrane protein